MTVCSITTNDIIKWHDQIITEQIHSIMESICFIFTSNNEKTYVNKYHL